MTRKRTVGDYWLWQTKAYGKPTLDDEHPVEVYKTRIIPSIPQGDYVASAKNPVIGDAALEELQGMSLEEARLKLLQKPGFYLNPQRRAANAMDLAIMDQRADAQEQNLKETRQFNPPQTVCTRTEAAARILDSHDMLEEAEKLRDIAEQCECVDCQGTRHE